MKKKIIIALFAMTAVATTAQNPVVQTCYTGDPALMASGDRMYLYVGHDEDKADFFWMYEWRCYSSSDMVNWTDHGSPLDLSAFEWADDRAWASQTIERDGKFYWYVCVHSKISKGMAIGVAVADSPTGPFRDAIGKPLYEDGKWDHIDPTVFIDDDGQAWIFWGNPMIYYAKLNKDMLSLGSEVKTVEQTIEGFGAPNFKERDKNTKYEDCYTEGPWIMKRNIYPVNRKGKAAKKPVGLYYLLYAAGGIPEHISYSTASSPEGPWTYRGNVMPLEETKSFTNHCGVADFKGHSYFVYHTGKLPGGGGFGRSAALEEFTYNADGTFPIIHHTEEGVKPIGTLNPYQRTEAETIAWAHGVKTDWNDKTGVYVSEIHNGDYIKVREVDFGNQSPKAFTASVASALQGGKIEVHLDSLAGQQIACLEVPHTGGWEEWHILRTTIANVTGKHDLYFAFTGNKGPKLFNFDWWKMEREPSIIFGTSLDAKTVMLQAQETAKEAEVKTLQTWDEGRDKKCAYFFEELGEEMPFRVCVPHDWDGKKKLPLVMFLHGGWNTESSYLDENDKLMVRLADQHGYLLVSPLGAHSSYGNRLLLPAGFGKDKDTQEVLAKRNAPELMREQELSEQDVINVLEIVLKNYPVDRSRMFLCGHSMGSGGTWYLGVKYADYWRALAPMSGPFVTREGYPWERIKQMPIFISEGTRAGASLQSSRDLRDFAEQYGLNYQYKEVDGDHGQMVPMILPDVFRFFNQYGLKAKPRIYPIK